MTKTGNPKAARRSRLSDVILPFEIVDQYELGRRLFRLRSKSGLTQPEVAKATNLVPYYISTLEHGKVQEPGVLKLLALAAFYGTTINRLLKP